MHIVRKNLPTRRLFIAFGLPAALRERLSAFARDIPWEFPKGSTRDAAPYAGAGSSVRSERVFRGVSPVPVGNMHMTLHFLGEVDAIAEASLKKGLAELAARHLPVDFRTAELLLLPSSRAPRILAVGCIPTRRGEAESARRLSSECAHLIGGLGIEVDPRPWRPHISIVRIRTATGRLAMESPPSIPFRIDAIDLMLSELEPSGAIYTRLGSFLFQGSL